MRVDGCRRPPSRGGRADRAEDERRRRATIVRIATTLDDPACAVGPADSGWRLGAAATGGGGVIGGAHRSAPVCGGSPPCSRWASAASTRRLPESSGSRSSFWKTAVMCFSTLPSVTMERPGDRLVRPALGDEREHGGLAIGEPLHPLVARAAAEQLRDDLRVEHRRARRRSGRSRRGSRRRRRRGPSGGSRAPRPSPR